MNNKKQVYMIYGFLESGKTQFINFTLNQDYFYSDDTTLLIVCEEGEEEYDIEALKEKNVVVEVLDDAAGFFTLDSMDSIGFLFVLNASSSFNISSFVLTSLIA